MPWHYKAKKEATTCDKRRRAGCELRCADVLIGKPGRLHRRPPDRFTAGATPGELKHLSTRRKRKRIDSVSSGERKRKSPNRLRAGL